jgi:tRNA A37 threonylcarbamoyladenosine biosynthesis protein TsaE
MTNEKKVVIIAAPNGAGKTTFAREFLPAEQGRLSSGRADPDW